MELINPTEERKLVEKSKKNKKDFDALYKIYYPVIKAYIYKRVYNKEDVDDIVSKIFLKTLRGIDDFKWQGVNFSSWVFRIAKNSLIDYYREYKKGQKVSSIEEKEIKSDENLDTLEYNYNLSNKLFEKIKKLDERTQKIVYMKFFEGYTNKSISQILDLTETNVSTLVYRALKKLKIEIGSRSNL